MAEKRTRTCSGRFAPKAPQPEAAKVGGGDKRERPLRPGQCRAHLRRELAGEFRGIVKGLIEQAKKGSCPHVKLATELLDLRQEQQPKKRRGPGPFTQMLQEIERREQEERRKSEPSALP